MQKRKNERKLGKELVALALANPVDPSLVSPPSSVAAAAFNFRSNEKTLLPVGRFVAMENTKRIAVCTQK